MATSHEDIHAALVKLDPDTEAHWTSEGAPRLDVLHQLTGDLSLDRKTVTEAAPNFSRSHRKLDPPTPGKHPDPVTESAPTAAKPPESVEEAVAPKKSKAAGQGPKNTLRAQIAALDKEIADADREVKAAEGKLRKLHDRQSALQTELGKIVSEPHAVMVKRMAEDRGKREAGIAVQHNRAFASQLDAVMSSRKPPHGAFRPQHIPNATPNRASN
jgi:hypothetical protein